MAPRGEGLRLPHRRTQDGGRRPARRARLLRVAPHPPRPPTRGERRAAGHLGGPRPRRRLGTARAGAGESLHDVVIRVRPLWEEELHERLTDGATVVVVAHGNTLRALCAVIDDLSDTEIEDLNIPAGHPLAYDVDHLGHARPRGGRYLDDAAAAVAAARVAAEGGT